MKILSFLGGLLLLAAWAPGARAVDGCRAADVNGDELVDATDVGIVADAIVFDPESPRADLDGDGILAGPDLVIVERYSVIFSEFREVLCPACPADSSGDGSIGPEDLQDVETVWGRDCRGDLNRDGVICLWDVKLLEAYLGNSTPLSMAAARADLDGDGEVDLADRDLLAQRVSSPISLRDCRLDLNRDGRIDSVDVWSLLAAWGPCPGPPPPATAARPNLEATCDEGKSPAPDAGAS
ncbi:MAG TPA: dockerin type I domain-containing protein [Thermoanaerobaculia bacterium]|jgi:hypothetical protein